MERKDNRRQAEKDGILAVCWRGWRLSLLGLLGF
jgi:hypothetical protein